MPLGGGVFPKGRLGILRQLASALLLLLPMVADALQTASRDVFQQVARSERADRSELNAEWPRDPGWFGGFAESESTFNIDGVGASLENPERDVLHGVDTANSLERGTGHRYAEPWQWFHESPSADRIAAWQSHYPPVQSHSYGNPWRHTPGSWDPQGWVQDYISANGDVAEKFGGPSAPEFFDSKVLQYDAFGRPMMPDKDGRRYVSPPWVERGVNTTLVCENPGCNATVHLQVYNPEEEVARNCALSVVFHPTDFDEDWSNENVAFIEANGQLLNRRCSPMARGCNDTAWAPVYPCVNSLPVDHIINKNGGIEVSAGISEMVDECPYEGNLMSSIVMLVCMVAPKSHAVNIASAEQTAPPPIMAEGDLWCAAAGCAASTTVIIDPSYAMLGGTCTMNVTVLPTDYDQENTAVEVIEFISINKENITTDVKPGTNPCVEAMSGDGVVVREPYVVLTDEDVTTMVRSAPTAGVLRVVAKNSLHVDECGVNGHLLDAHIAVRCLPPSESASAAEAESE